MEATAADIDQEQNALEKSSGAFVLFSFGLIKACPRKVRTVRPAKRRSRRASGSSSPPPKE
jgi:hypothetical protein